VRQIAENAGEHGAVVAGKILDSSDNAQSGEYGDLVKQGVVGAAKVVRTALQDAASVAGLLVTTEAWWRRSQSRKLRRRCLLVVAFATWTTRQSWSSRFEGRLKKAALFLMSRGGRHFFKVGRQGSQSAALNFS
jgi:hypothetical protein